MQNTDYKNWHPSSHDVEFSDTTVCRYFEFLQYCDQRKPVQRGIFDDSLLESWSRKGCESDCSSGQEPSSVVRILIGECNLNYSTGLPRLSFTKETFTKIMTRFGLPIDEFLSLVSTSQNRALRFHGEDKDNIMIGLIFKIGFYRSEFYQLTVSYEKKKRLTHCLIISKDLNFQDSTLFKRFQEKLMKPNQELSLPFVALELEINSCEERLIKADLKLNVLEETMGQHEYTDRPVGNPLEMDFLTTTRSLNYISKRLGVDTTRVKSLMIAMETIQKLMSDDAFDGRVLDECKMAFMKDSCRTLLLSLEYEEKRTQMLIQVVRYYISTAGSRAECNIQVYQFMAQKDSKVNISLAQNSAIMAKASKEDSAVMRTIAVETKRDSSSMKTIAVLGMFFLPGTFIAAIFAMPVFEWGDNGIPMVKTGFKYYWAVTIPLTVLVLLTWSLAMLLPWRSWLERVSKSGQVLEHLEE